jgi:hypothetical protein
MLPKVEHTESNIEKVEDSIWEGTKSNSSKESEKIIKNLEFLWTDFIYILTVINEY